MIESSRSGARILLFIEIDQRNRAAFTAAKVGGGIGAVPFIDGGFGVFEPFKFQNIRRDILLEEFIEF